MTLIFDSLLKVVSVRAAAKFQLVKCSGSCVIVLKRKKC